MARRAIVPFELHPGWRCCRGGARIALVRHPDVRDRHVRVWRFLNVRDLVLSANGPELQEHHGAGHVIQARLFESDRVDLNVYLCGAYLRVTADGVEDAVEDDPFGDAENASRDQSAASAAAESSKAMTAGDAEVILDFSDDRRLVRRPSATCDLHHRRRGHGRDPGSRSAETHGASGARVTCIPIPDRDRCDHRAQQRRIVSTTRERRAHHAGPHELRAGIDHETTGAFT